jgi:ATP-dependent Lon protease
LRFSLPGFLCGLVIAVCQGVLSGELSLTGEMWPVDGRNEKLEGAARAGLKKALLPLSVDIHGVQDPFTRIPDGLEVVHVSTVFEAINHMVIGESATIQPVVHRHDVPMPSFLLSISLGQLFV